MNVHGITLDSRSPITNVGDRFRGNDTGGGQKGGGGRDDEGRQNRGGHAMNVYGSTPGFPLPDNKCRGQASREGQRGAGRTGSVLPLPLRERAGVRGRNCPPDTVSACVSHDLTPADPAGDALYLVLPSTHAMVS